MKRSLVSFVGRKAYCMESTLSQKRRAEKKPIAEDNHLVSATVNCHPFNSFMFVPSEITHSWGLIKKIICSKFFDRRDRLFFFFVHISYMKKYCRFIVVTRKYALFFIWNGHSHNNDTKKIRIGEEKMPWKTMMVYLFTLHLNFRVRKGIFAILMSKNIM